MTDQPAIAVHDLWKSHRARPVLRGVSFDVQRGHVTALLGPNGAGKSTTMRALLGLVSTSRGSVKFDGRSYADLDRPGREVGVLLDAASMHAGRTVFETARTAGLAVGVDAARVHECLHMVGLGTVMRRRVGALSLGMRQRLGLAVALLGEPSILLLDEPGNGLDPEGLHWLHGLLTDLASKGGAVLISSHHLAEVERLAHELVVLDRGKVVPGLSGPVPDVGSSPQSRSEKTDVTSVDDAALALALRAEGMTVAARTRGLRVDAPAWRVGQTAHAAGLPLTSLVGSGIDLESMFLEATSGEHESSDQDVLAGPQEHHVLDGTGR